VFSNVSWTKPIMSALTPSRIKGLPHRQTGSVQHYPPGIAQDVESADLRGVSGTLTFFVNGKGSTAHTTWRP